MTDRKQWTRGSGARRKVEDFNVRTDAAFAERIDRFCVRFNLTRSELIRRLLDQAMKTLEAGQ